MYSGMDWSGNPDKDRHLFCAIAATQDTEHWNNVCSKIRRSFGWKQGAEFHARDMKEAQRKIILMAACETGFKFGVVRWDKANMPSEKGGLFTYEKIAESLFSEFTAQCELRKLWYDTEIKGKAAQHQFETLLYRANRRLKEERRFEAKCRASHASDMVQAADVLAYMVHRMTQNTIKDQELRVLVKQILRNKRSVWINGQEGGGSDLRL